MSDGDDINFEEEVEILDLPNHLKEKAGEGGISDHFLEKAEGFIRDNDIDFAPFALQHLTIIDDTLKELKEETKHKKQKKLLSTIIENIMHIKAHGGMFSYSIMSKISGLTLTFLDDIEHINEELFEIIEAHSNSSYLIINNKITGDGGELANPLSMS